MNRKKILRRPRLTILVLVSYGYRDGGYCLTKDGDEEAMLLINIIADTTLRDQMFFEIRPLGRPLPFNVLIDMVHRFEFHYDFVRRIPNLSGGPYQVHAEPSPRGDYLTAEMMKHSWVRPGEALQSLAAYLFATLGLNPEKVILSRMDFARVEEQAGVSVPFVVMAQMMIDDRSFASALKDEVSAITAKGG